MFYFRASFVFNLLIILLAVEVQGWNFIGIKKIPFMLMTKLNEIYSLPREGLPSEEENIKLEISIEPCSFLTNIKAYGDARMARRAVGILEKMKAYRAIPGEEHYTAAIWACEKSDQFDQAMGVLKKMKKEGVPRTSSTYAGLISCADKSGRWEEAFELLNEMKSENLALTTNIYNSVMWACDKVSNIYIIIHLLIISS